MRVLLLLFLIFFRRSVNDIFTKSIATIITFGGGF